MKNLIPLIVALTLPAPVHSAPTPAVPAPLRFDATLRVDLHHVGNHQREQYMVDSLRQEGPWPGSPAALIDTTGYGSGLAEVFDAGPRGRLLFSQSFCTLYGEWKTSAEAKNRFKTFSETVRFPMPSKSVRLVIKSRQRRGQMKAVFQVTLDPTSWEIQRDRRHGGLKVIKLHQGGPPENSLDVVILGDGYQAWQMDKYRQDAVRYAELLLSTPPFAQHRRRINIWGVESPSRHSGVDEPRKGVYRDTVLSMGFNMFNSPRYLMTEDNRAVRDVAANAHYDAIFIMSNTSRYGGGGIYNLYASFVSDNEYDEYVFIHEFGHSFAGLGDEYYSSSVAYSGMYPRGVEPWEPNITAQRRRGRIKWRAMIKPQTPIPTPEQDPAQAEQVGLFEGAGYSAKGLFRPAVDCKMFNKGRKPFCPVCMKGVEQMIKRFAP